MATFDDPQPISPAQQQVYDRHGIDHSSEAVRFLRIRNITHDLEREDSVKIFDCAFEVHEISDPPEYTALSYEWGADELVDDATLVVDGIKWPIRRNLYNALHCIWDREDRELDDELNAETERYVSRLQLIGFETPDRAPTQPLLWVDYLCIAQGNHSERNHQVSQMSQIYRSASSVIVWLGEADDDSHDAITFLGYVFHQDLSDHTRTREKLRSFLDEPAYQISVLPKLNKLFSRAYWSRMWIVQEFILAPQLLVFAGRDNFCIHRDVKSGYAWTRALDVPSQYASREGLASGMGWNLFKFEAATSYRNKGMTWALANTTMGWTILFLVLPRGKQCYDPRDKIFGILGLTSGDHNWPQVDYSLSIEELFSEVVRKYRRFATTDEDHTAFATALASSLRIDYKKSEQDSQ